MKTLVAIPCGDMVHTDFVRALMSMRMTGEVQITWAQGSLIYDARNQLCEIALNGGFERVLWLDSDMQFQPDLFERLHARLDEGKELVSGLYFTRKTPVEPVAYKTLLISHEKQWPQPHIAKVDAWGDEPMQISGCGFGAVMTSTELLARVRKEYGTPFTPINNLGEDLAFCWKASQLGADLWLDPTIKCGHVGLALYTEETFRAIQASKKEVIE